MPPPYHASKRINDQVPSLPPPPHKTSRRINDPVPTLPLLPDDSKKSNDHVPGPLVPGPHQDPKKVVESAQPIVFPSGGNSALGIAALKSGKHLVVTNDLTHNFSIISLSGQIVRTVGGYGNKPGEFAYPKGVAVDSDGNIWVTDCTNKRLQCFTEDGVYRSSFPTPFQPNAVEIFPDGDCILVSFNFEGNHQSNRIFIFTPEGDVVTSFGTTGTGPEQFGLNIFGIKATNYDEILVTDSDNDRVHIFSSSGQWKRSLGEGQLADPTGLAVASNGHLLVVECDGARISIWSRTGQLMQRWGSKGKEPGKLKEPWHVAILPDGRIAFTEFGNNRIQLIDQPSFNQ